MLPFRQFSVLACTLLAGCWTFDGLGTDSVTNNESNNTNVATNNGGTTGQNLNSANGTEIPDAPAGCEPETFAAYAETRGLFYPTGEVYGRAITFTVLRTDPPTAVLGWTQQNNSGSPTPFVAAVDLFDESGNPRPEIHDPGTTLAIPEYDTGWYTFSLATGPNSVGTGFVQAISMNGCNGETSPVFLDVDDGVNRVQVSAPAGCPSPGLWAMELGGGYDPLVGRSNMPPTAIYLAEETYALAALRAPFDVASYMGSIWNSPGPDDPAAWIQATRGRLALLSDDAGGLHVWDTQQCPPQTDCRDATIEPPIALIDRSATRGSAALVALGDEFYALGTSDDDEARVEIVDYNPAISAVSILDEGGWRHDLSDSSPIAYEVAPIFHGIVSVWFRETSDGTQWGIEPLLARDNAFDYENCSIYQGHVAENILDLDVEAIRIGDDLYVLAAIHLVTKGTASIVVDGAYLHDFYVASTSAP